MNTAWLACEPDAAARSRLGAEQLLDAIDRQLLGDVDELAAAVVALAGIALGVLVGELRALRGHDRRARVVLRGDQLDVLFLAPVLRFDRAQSSGSDFSSVCVRENMAGPHRARAGRNTRF